MGYGKNIGRVKRTCKFTNLTMKCVYKKGNTMSYKVLIFDLDGTLLDTTPDILNAVNTTFDQYKEKQVTIKDIKRCLGNGAKNLISCLLERKDVDTIVSDYVQYYDLHAQIETKPYPSILELLNNLKDYSKVLYSNKDQSTVETLADYHFKDTFKYIAGTLKDYPIKPDPKRMNELINKHNLNKDEILFIGDSEVDYLTSQNIGVDCCLVTWGFRDKDVLMREPAKYMIDHPMELLHILNNHR